MGLDNVSSESVHTREQPSPSFQVGVPGQGEGQITLRYTFKCPQLRLLDCIGAACYLKRSTGAVWDYKEAAKLMKRELGTFLCPGFPKKKTNLYLVHTFGVHLEVRFDCHIPSARVMCPLFLSLLWFGSSLFNKLYILYTESHCKELPFTTHLPPSSLFFALDVHHITSHLPLNKYIKHNK